MSLQDNTIPPYIYNAINLIKKEFDFAEKSVLEIGGSCIPDEIIFQDLKCKLWVSVDMVTSPGGGYQLKKFSEHYKKHGIKKFADYDQLPENGYIIFDEAAEKIPDYFHDKFDFVVSINAFEHILNLKEVLDKIHKCLKNEGILFSIFGPIWSSCAGSHFRINEDLYFDKPSSLPSWFHLLLSKEEIRLILRRNNFDNKIIENIIYQTFEAPTINRFFYEDYVSIMNKSPFSEFEITKMWPRAVPAHIQKELEIKYPGKREFSAYSLLIKAKKIKKENSKNISEIPSIFITGCGRSGTSCLAGLFDTGCFYMGDNLYPPSESNPKGFYENTEINSINEQLIIETLLNKYGDLLTQFYLRDFKPGQLWLAVLPEDFRVYACSKEIMKAIRSLIVKRPFCFKDPRFVYTIETWLNEAPESLVLCVFRHPSKTYTSLIKEILLSNTYLKDFKVSTGYLVELWNTIYVRLLKLYTMFSKVYFINYEDLFNERKIAELENLIGVKLNKTFPDKNISKSDVILPINKKTEAIYNTLLAIASDNFGSNRTNSIKMIDELFKNISCFTSKIPEPWAYTEKDLRIKYLFNIDLQKIKRGLAIYVEMLSPKDNLLENFADYIDEGYIDLEIGRLRLKFQLVTLFKDKPVNELFLYVEEADKYFTLMAEKVQSPYIGERYKNLEWSKESRFKIDYSFTDELFKNKGKFKLFARVEDEYRLIGFIKAK